MHAQTNARIEAVVVNHNTSAYTELMLRSLFQRHPDFPLALTVLDNASTDAGLPALMAYARQRAVPVRPSGFGLDTRNNSHGELLRRFVLDHADCTHYLFLDADVCFTQDDTLPTLLAELAAAPDAFGIGPRMSLWDDVTEIPLDVRQANPDICDARLHPCCALVRNTPLVRMVVDAVGLMAGQVLWAEREEYLDTFKLFTRVMATHGQRHVLSSAMLLHFFAVSYAWDAEAVRAQKAEERDRRLARLRAGEG